MRALFDISAPGRFVDQLADGLFGDSQVLGDLGATRVSGGDAGERETVGGTTRKAGCSHAPVDPVDKGA